jgi:hypothetical protein
MCSGQLRRLVTLQHHYGYSSMPQRQGMCDWSENVYQILTHAQRLVKVELRTPTE